LGNVIQGFSGTLSNILTFQRAFIGNSAAGGGEWGCRECATTLHRLAKIVWANLIRLGQNLDQI